MLALQLPAFAPLLLAEYFNIGTIGVEIDIGAADRVSENPDHIVGAGGRRGRKHVGVRIHVDNRPWRKSPDIFKHAVQQQPIIGNARAKGNSKQPFGRRAAGGIGIAPYGSIGQIIKV